MKKRRNFRKKPKDNSIGLSVTVYNNNVDGKAGAWGTIIPNTLAKGIRRIDRRKFDDHSLLHSQRDTNGVWFTIDTKNPSGGSSTPIKLTVDEAALVPTEVNFVTPFVTINESQDSFTVIVQRKYSTEDTAKITVSLVGGTATDGLDFNFPGNQVLTFAPGALRSDSFKFNIIDDLLTEGDEVVTLKLIDPVNTTIGASPTLSLTIVDNDVPIIKFVDKVIVTREGLGNVIGRIAIENGTASVTSIHAAVQSKSALTSIPGEFYLSINDPNDTLVRFSNGLSKDTFKMMGFIVDDAVIDAPDTIYIVLRNPSGTATIGADSVLMIIVKDDDAPPGVRFIGSSLTVNENIGNAKVQVEILNRNNNPSDFSLKYIGSRSTTTEGSDLTFNPTSQIFTFGLTGSDTMTINIPIIDDTNFEMDEVAVFAVEGTVNNTTLKPDTFRITINSDDAEKLTISAASAINITTGVITRAGDKVIVSGIVHGYNRAATGMQFTVIDATGGIQISSALKTFSYTVKEGDSISVQGIVSQALGVAQLSSLDTIVLHKTGLATYSPAAVTKFDENSEQEIVVVNNVRFTDVSAWPTAALSANGEAFAKAVNSTNDSLIIRIDAEGPLNGTPAPSKALYYKITGIGSQNDNTTPYLSNYYIDPSKLSDVAVINSPKLSFAISTLTVVETSDSTPAIQVNIANSGFQNVSFKIDSNTGTARVPLDFTFTPISLSFLPSVSSYSFQVNLSDDADKDGDKTIILVLRNPGYGVLIGTDSILTITISDNETGIKTLNPSLVKVYPNPSNGMIYLETKKIISSVKIYNMNGLEIENSNENTNFVSLKNQASGIYQLILEIEGELYTTRVQKN